MDEIGRERKDENVLQFGVCDDALESAAAGTQGGRYRHPMDMYRPVSLSRAVTPFFTQSPLTSCDRFATPVRFLIA